MSNEVTDDSFQKIVLDSGVLTLVDFWAPWCGPCRMLGPIIEEISQDLKGKVNVFKMNIDDNPNIPSEFGIRSIPTMILFKGGKQLDVKIGSLPKESIINWIESHS